MFDSDRRAIGFAVAVDFSVRQDVGEDIHKEVSTFQVWIPGLFASTWWSERTCLGSAISPEKVRVRVRVGEFAEWEPFPPKVRMTVLIVGQRPGDKVCKEMQYLLFGTFAQSFNDPTVGRRNFVLVLGWLSDILEIGATDGVSFER